MSLVAWFTASIMAKAENMNWVTTAWNRQLLSVSAMASVGADAKWPLTHQVKGAKLMMSLVSGFCSDWTVQSETGDSDAAAAGDGAQPFCR